ncbi:MAG: thiamine diphosphokinase [Chloroflexi bacterium]|nr:thiamine diphosphokinase [Chloroflexota bacterium]
MRAVLFANGDLNDLEGARALLRPDDLLLAADGGGRHCLRLDLKPAAVIGDMDSLLPDELDQLAAGGAEILRHPANKDETDLQLALRLAKERGASEALVLGGLGGRWDMSLANLLLAAYDPLAGLRVTFWQDGQRLSLIQGAADIHGRPGETVSLIPLGGDAIGVTTTDLEYPLHGETLPFGGTRGVSNVLLGETARVTLEGGLLLCVIGQNELS